MLERLKRLKRKVVFYPQRKSWIKTANGSSYVVSHPKLQTVTVLWIVMEAARGYCNKTAEEVRMQATTNANGCSSMDAF